MTIRRALPLLLLGLAACDEGAPTAPVDDAGPVSLQGLAHMVEQEPVPLPDSVLWYRGTALQSFDYPQDEDGVIMFEHGGAWHYHPVQMAQKALALTDNYRRTGDTLYLGHAVRHVERLLQEADTIGGALYFPYTFDWDLHGIPRETEYAPWYSGMAQGQILSLLVRLHRMTGESSYRDAADAVATSFLRLRGEAVTYTAMVDGEGYYWIEEYPMHEATGTLNGFIFGIWGAYEYWMLTGDPEMERVVRASLATLRRYLPEFRVPGGISYYCLKHRRQYTLYHTIHISQLRHVEQLSGDAWFGEFADTLASDA